MIRQEYAWVTLPSGVMLALASLGEIVCGFGLIGPATIAVLLTLPVAVFSLWWMRRLMARWPGRVPVGMIATTLLRMMVAFGGGCLVYFYTDWEPARGLALWLSIAVAYLSTLAAEVFVLAKPGWVGRGGVGRKG